MFSVPSSMGNGSTLGLFIFFFFFYDSQKGDAVAGTSPRELPPRVATEVAKLFWSVFISAFPAIK